MMKLWHIHTMEYKSKIKKRMTTDASNIMDGSQKHYAKWKNPERKKELLIIKFDFDDILEKAKL